MKMIDKHYHPKPDLKPTDKDMLNVAIRYIEQLLTSKGQHMTRAQIFELIRKTAIKHAYNTEDNIKIIKELFN